MLVARTQSLAQASQAAAAALSHRAVFPPSRRSCSRRAAQCFANAENGRCTESDATIIIDRGLRHPSSAAAAARRCPLLPAPPPPRPIPSCLATVAAGNVSVSFQLPYRCKFGQQLCLVGDSKELGAWDVAEAVPMTWTDGDVWVVDMQLTPE